MLSDTCIVMYRDVFKHVFRERTLNTLRYKRDTCIAPPTTPIQPPIHRDTSIVPLLLYWSVSFLSSLHNLYSEREFSIHSYLEDYIVATPSAGYEVLDYLVEYIKEGEIDYNIIELLCGSFKPTPLRGKSVIDEIENQNNDEDDEEDYRHL